MPEEKQDVVRALQAEGHTVAVVGDGTNDAPALALADVGTAMGVSGTDVAVETADVALAGHDLTRLLELRDLGRRAIGLIRQNYGMSIAVNAAGLLVSTGGALSSVVAAILHHASSVAVVANSSRHISIPAGRVTAKAARTPGTTSVAMRSSFAGIASRNHSPIASGGGWSPEPAARGRARAREGTG